MKWVSRVTSRPPSCSCRWPDNHVTMLSSTPWLAPGSTSRPWQEPCYAGWRRRGCGHIWLPAFFFRAVLTHLVEIPSDFTNVSRHTGISCRKYCRRNLRTLIGLIPPSFFESAFSLPPMIMEFSSLSRIHASNIGKSVRDVVRSSETANQPSSSMKNRLEVVE